MSNENKLLTNATKLLSQEYNSALPNRYASNPVGVNNFATDADSQIQWGYDTTVEWGRELDRNSPEVIPALNALVSSVIGKGFVPSPDTGSDRLDKRLYEAFCEFSEDKFRFDYNHEFTYQEAQEIIFRSAVRDGDVFVLPMAGGAIQIVESQYCRNPDVPEPNNNTKDFLGKRKVNGVTVGYWFAENLNDPPKYFPAYDNEGYALVWQIAFPKRAGLSRGVSTLNSVRDTAQMQTDCKLATLYKAKINSMVCVVETDQQNPVGNIQPRTPGAPDRAQDYKLRPGATLRANAGKNINFFQGNVPNPEFFPHVEMNNREICAVLGVPKESAFMDPTKANFSALRQSIQDARQIFESYQQKLIARFHQPLWTHFIRTLIALNPSLRRHDIKDLLRCRFNPPRWKYLEPLTDAQSDTERIRNRTASYSMITRERHGVNADVIAEETIRDTGFFIERCAKEADRLSKLGVDVCWREIASIATAPRGTLDHDDLMNHNDIPNDGIPGGGESEDKTQGTENAAD